MIFSAVPAGGTPACGLALAAGSWWKRGALPRIPAMTALLVPQLRRPGTVPSELS